MIPSERPHLSRPERLARLTPLACSVTVEAPQETNFSSFTLAGLFDLVHAGVIPEIRIRPSLDLHRGEVHVDSDGTTRRTEFPAYKSVRLTVAGSTTTTVVIDHRDSARIFPVDGLAADVLFKRSFTSRSVAVVAPIASGRIEPAGLIVGVRSAHGRQRGAQALGYWARNVRWGTKLDRDVARRLFRHLRAASVHARLRSTQPWTSDFGDPSPRSDNGTVFFRTRTFDREDDDVAVAAQEQRAELIRAMQEHFGPRFVGGFVPSDFARARYPDCLSEAPTDPASYRREMVTASVVLSTSGLAGAVPWKISEYLGTGRCIVTEPFSTRLPAKLDGITTTFRSPEEAVSKTDSLLSDAPARARRGALGLEYYRRWIDPPMAMHRMLTQVLATPTS